MRDELVQRCGVVRRRFALVAEGIRVTEASLTSGRTVVVPYEVVYGETFERWSSSIRALLATIVMAVLAVVAVFVSDAERFAWLFWSIGAALAGAYYWATRREEVGYYDNGARIVFFRDRPSAEAFDAYLDEIHRRARERVRNRLLPLRPSGDARVDRERADKLLEKDIISEQERTEFLRDSSATAPASHDPVQN
jgi:hypothetical protein